MKITEKLSKVQSELKAPKNQFNSFGKYKYRSCEDILEAAKPLCIKHGLVLTVHDDIKIVGTRIYVEATARLDAIEGEESFLCKALARESETKKGMDDSQITGAASSYARKYALSGLFAIDDTKDADAEKPEDKKPVAKPKATPKKEKDAAEGAPTKTTTGAKVASKSQVEFLTKLINKKGIDINEVCKNHDIVSLDEIPFKAASLLISEYTKGE